MASIDSGIRDEAVALEAAPRVAHAAVGARTHFRRFTPFQRWVHFFIMISFSMLVLTGMPLKYSDKAWAQTWMGFIGGVQNAGMIHRFAAMIMVTCVICMLGFFAVILIRTRGRFWGPGSMVPNWQDYHDLKAMVSWFVGKSTRPKLQLDRYAYYEKGEFWAASGGVTIMCVTGAILWYPEVAARYLPGIVINFALVNHSGGALLAMGFVVVFWHFFHAHLRPEAFPMDKAMYDGRPAARGVRPRAAARVRAPGARGQAGRRARGAGQREAHEGRERRLVDHHRRGAVPLGGVHHLRRLGDLQLAHLVLRVNSFTRTGTLMRAGTSSHEPR